MNQFPSQVPSGFEPTGLTSRLLPPLGHHLGSTTEFDDHKSIHDSAKPRQPSPRARRSLRHHYHEIIFHNCDCSINLTWTEATQPRPVPHRFLCIIVVYFLTDSSLADPLALSV